MRGGRLDETLCTIGGHPSVYRKRAIFRGERASCLCYHARLRGGRHIWRGRRPAPLALLRHPRIGTSRWGETIVRKQPHVASGNEGPRRMRGGDGGAASE